MDLNHLYHRRGVSLLMAQRATCKQSQNAHLSFARTYTARIALARGQSCSPAA